MDAGSLSKLLALLASLGVAVLVTHAHSNDASESLGGGLEWRVEVLKALARELDQP